MYFAILGKHKQISLAELQYTQPSNLRTHGPIAIFDTEFPDKLTQLGGIIKRGQVTTLEEWVKLQDHKALIGTNSRLLGQYLKKNSFTKRFKELTLDHTDTEIQKDGQELINIHSSEDISDQTLLGIVEGYQDIGLFESIDFDKPSAGMGIGMMPSKLALTMINIALSQHQAAHQESINSRTEGEQEYTIYDPFCGFGTTNFLANAHHHHTIGSDINGSLIKPNLERRKSNPRHDDSRRITTFKHDATQPIAKAFVAHSDVIVTEGWLGPVVSTRLMPRVAHHQLKQIGDVYCGFLTQMDTYFDTIIICMTIPVYRFYEVNVIHDMIENLLGSNTKRQIQAIPQMYERKGQYVMRQILLLQKK